MPILISIGCMEFLVKNEAQAIKAMAALAGMIALESRYTGNSALYWPSDCTYKSKISLEHIRPDQLLSRDPSKCKPADGPKQITNEPI